MLAADRHRLSETGGQGERQGGGYGEKELRVILTDDDAMIKGRERKRVSAW